MTISDGVVPPAYRVQRVWRRKPSKTEACLLFFVVESFCYGIKGTVHSLLRHLYSSDMVCAVTRSWRLRP